MQQNSVRRRHWLCEPLVQDAAAMSSFRSAAVSACRCTKVFKTLPLPRVPTAFVAKTTQRQGSYIHWEQRIEANARLWREATIPVHLS